MTISSASERQTQASEPAASTWLSANAGSGKTRVLTDRVARLLLAGVEPQLVLCLTYTKAAASEMQNRLFKRLGEWAMMRDGDLRAALVSLGNRSQHDAEALARARRLFARAIETPGGLRIQTIHSFCSSLLRRFPLEAGVSPQFTELDDRTARLMRAEILEEMADTLAPEIMADIARVYTGDDFTQLMDQVVRWRDAFSTPTSLSKIRATFNIAPEDSETGLLADVFLGNEAGLMSQILPILQQAGGNDEKAAAKLSALDFFAPNAALLAVLETVFLTSGSANEPFSAKIGSFPTKSTRARIAEFLPELENLMQRVESARWRRVGLQAADRTMTLHHFAAFYLPIYSARKSARGWLDFDDLIQKTISLLTDPRVAAWVLFRLDGGIDHILVDEAQDTSPDQWRVIELLAAEFTVGAGARRSGRTLFVVGDKKQSIYSFQGADIAAFDEKQLGFKTKFEAAGQQMQNLQLEYSFRSSPAILNLVDRTFSDHFPEAMGDNILHLAFKGEMPGRVDLWPLIEPVKSITNEEWQDPVDLISETHHSAQLALKIASSIKDLIDAGTQIPTDDGDRAVHAGDFLILVQRRSVLFSEIIRCCKQLGLPIAGADRLKLGAELAVKDLSALLSFLATPEDNLSLATLLRSPLCGWSEAELFDLAYGRKGFLWEQMRARAADFPETMALLNDLRDKTDFLRPYDLIERVLTRHDGRRRLVARLGLEAEDGIDEFLTQALAYERLDVPSLTGFLIWLETDEVEVKRQMDSEGQRIRVMTVHGAKGLEAPIVILPDTVDRNPQDREEIYLSPQGMPIWKTAKDSSPAVVSETRAVREKRRQDESLRLLYVALTRARCWLIVAGAGEAKLERGGQGKTSSKQRSEWAWYRLVEDAMKDLGAELLDEGRLRYHFGKWPLSVAQTAPPQAAPPASLPEWVLTASPPAPREVRFLSPSNLGGEKVLLGETDTAPENAMARGTALHLLLERLPEANASNWSALSIALIPDESLRNDVFNEATTLLAAPHLKAIFTKDALTEVVVTADLPFGRMLGSIDRLIVESDQITAIDYKSNRLVPSGPDQVPEGLLRQMGAYHVALAQVYPGRKIEVAILWTKTGHLMPLGLDIVSAALARATIDSVSGP